MKRFLVLCAALVPSLFLVGCESDARIGLIKDTTLLLGNATGKVSDIKNRLAAAIKTAEETGKKIDFTEVTDSLKGLKEVGGQAQILKKNIDQVRLEVSEQDRKAYAEKERNNLSTAFAELLKAKKQLNDELTRAETIQDGKNRPAVSDFRAKLIEAESPFEALARQ